MENYIIIYIGLLVIAGIVMRILEYIKKHNLRK